MKKPKDETNDGKLLLIRKAESRLAPQSAMTERLIKGEVTRHKTPA